MGTRRGHGEGSIYQRGDGLWCTAVDLGYVNGKRKRKYIYGQTRKEVADKLKVVLRDQQLGLPITTERQTVEQFLTRWLTDVVEASVRPRTFESYSSTARLHIIPALGRLELTKLTAQHVQALLRTKSREGLSAQSVRNVRAVLRIALNQAVRWDLIPRNVATLVSPPRAERHEVPTFTPEEARQFLAAARGDRLEALFTVALALGLRQGEAFGLRWPDIDLDHGVLRVRTSLQRIHGKLTFTQPKTEKSRRTISLPATTVAALRAHRVRQMEERLAAGSRWEDHNLVFANTEGKPLEKGQCRQAAQRVAR